MAEEHQRILRYGALALWALLGGAACLAANASDPAANSGEPSDIKAETTKLIAQDLKNMGEIPAAQASARSEAAPAAVNPKPLLLAPVVVTTGRQNEKLQDKMDEVAAKARPFNWKDGGKLKLGPIPVDVSYNSFFRGFNLLSLGF